MATIAVVCVCGKDFHVREQFAGKRMRCPECGHIVSVPAGDDGEPNEEQQEQPAIQHEEHEHVAKITSAPKKFVRAKRRGRYSSPYLTPGRLEDVLALIQILGLDDEVHRTESAIEREGLGQPQSRAASWILLAGEHPEFFRVTVGPPERVSLVARHFNKPLLAPSDIMTLLDAAIKTYGAEINRQQINRTGKWVFGGVSVVGLLVTVAQWALQHHETIREVIRSFFP